MEVALHRAGPPTPPASGTVPDAGVARPEAGGRPTGSQRAPEGEQSRTGDSAEDLLRRAKRDQRQNRDRDQRQTRDRGHLPPRTALAAAVGKAASGASRRLRRGEGSVIGGRAILAVDRAALARLATGRQVALVSGTNGKTTTTRFLSAALSTGGPVATNSQGANLPPGIAYALATAPAKAAAALEVDEAWLGRVAASTAPEAIVLLNLSRDQLDRNNELRHLSSAWRSKLAGCGATIIANADDPLVVWGAGGAGSVIWVGAGQPWTADASGCPSCGGPIAFRGGGEGWACGGCDLARPDLDVALEGGDVVHIGDGWQAELRLALPGRANCANAAMALATAVVLGADPTAALEAMEAVEQVQGRYATVVANHAAGSTEARLLLAKNPAGWLEVLNILRPAPVPVVVGINARVADGRDPSWLWDVPFEALRGRLVIATGERSADLAVRLRYADVEHLRRPDPLEAISAAGAPSVDVVANYTAFQDLRARLAR